MMHGVYIGPDDGLKGRSALLRMNLCEPGWLAQFDDMWLYQRLPDRGLYRPLGFGWHPFALSDFDLDCTKSSRVGMGEFMRDNAERRGWKSIQEYYHPEKPHARPEPDADVGPFLLIRRDDVHTGP